MKKNILPLFPILLFGLLSTLNLFAQAPDAMIYQAEARDERGHLIRNKTVDVRLAIQEGSIGGPEVWINNYNITTDNYGLFTITLGDPTNTNDDLYNIEWEKHPFFLDVQVLYKGIWINVGTTQFLSVPYALHARTATNALSASYDDIEGAPTDLSEFTNFADYITNAEEQDPVFNGWDMSTGISITESQISDLVHFTNSDETDPSFDAWDKSAGISITESQISDLAHFTNTDETDPLFAAAPASNISDDNIANWIAAYGWGNHSDAGYLVSELDADPTNELQDLSNLALKSNVLELDNTTEFTPDADYEPATKKYVDDNAGSGATTYNIGDFAQGGVVFWVDETGQNGLVCAKVDQSSGVRWDAGTFGNTQAKGDGPFSGEANTAIIIAAHVAIGDDGSTFAARICNELQITEGDKTYGDWYLPSKEELNLIYQNKSTIDATATSNGGTAFASYYYWSSAEYNYGLAWFQSFVHGGQGTNLKDVTYNRVRAVRAF